MAAINETLPSVRDVLRLPELSAGEPELVTGDVGLDRGVRWAHVVAGPDAAGLLDGGELVLTTGAGWPQESIDPRGLALVATKLVEADPAAIVFELGVRYQHAPDALVKACRSHGTPLIVLHRVVRFVQITQRVHQRLLAVQNEALEARAEVHAMLTELGLNRSPVDYVVDRIAATLDAPVVLEDAGHRVVAWAGPDTSALDHWTEARFSRHGLSPPLPAGATQVPVEAQGSRWGLLTALDGPAHPAGRETVLELGAFALALARLADPDGEQWIELTAKRLFDTVLEGRYSGERELESQLSASGLPFEGHVLLGATLTGLGDFGAHESLESAILSTAFRRAVAPEGRVILTPAPQYGARTMLALLAFPDGDERLPDALAIARQPLAARLNHELNMMLPAATPAAWRAHLSLGVTATRPLGLIASLEQVALGESASSASGAWGSRPGNAMTGSFAAGRASGRVTVQLAAERPLAYLVRGLAGAPELQEFAASMLQPLVEHDAGSGTGHSGDLLQVLGAYLAHPTNRSLAAQRARLSRSVFYQRIDLIEDLLGVDLTDGETIASLTVALLARGGM